MIQLSASFSNTVFVSSTDNV